MVSLIQKIFLLLCFFTGTGRLYAADCKKAFLSREDNPEVVPVTALSPEWPNIRKGTGIFVSDSQTLAAPLHLASPLKQSKHLTYFFEDPNTGESVPLQPFAADLKSDLMLLRTPESYQSDFFYSPEQFADIEKYKDFEKFNIAGFSGWSEQWTSTQGTMSAYRDDTGKYLSIMDFKNTVQKGSGGGPVFSEEGSLLGIAAMGGIVEGEDSLGGEDVNMVYVTPVGDLKSLLIRSDSSVCRTTVCLNEWKKWRRQALLGDKEAQFLMGREAVFLGEEISGEYQRAISWLEKSAEQHYAPALSQIGDMFYAGMGVSQNIPLATEYYLQAAAEGEAIAQNNLGMMAEDPESAAKWFLKSARQGFPFAVFSFGYMSLFGYGTEKDYVVAEEYLLKAARYGMPPAKLFLGRMYREQGDFIKARRWLLEVQHLPEAQFEIASMFAGGEGFEKNLQKAYNWYQKAADGGEPLSQLNTGMFYIMGKGREKDVEKGIFYLTQSAEQGVIPAIHNLGYTFRIRGDYQQAMKWLLKAAYAGDPVSQRNVGDMYRKGEGTKKDSTLAEKWLLESAGRGYAPAMYDLSEMYRTGEGSVLRDLEKADYWLRESQKQDYTPEDPRWHDGGEKVNGIAYTELTPVSHL